MKNATITLWADADFNEPTRSLVSTHAGHMTGNIAVLPSSLDSKDPFAEMVSKALPEVSQPFTAIPVSGAAARRAFLTPTVLGSWIDLPINLRDSAINAIAWPNELAHANHRIAVTDVVEIARKGPFILDLAARYMHPRQRMRLLSSGDRESQAAEVASGLPFDLFVIYLAQREGMVLAVTTDIIAAELAAIAMSELCVGAPRSFAGPWEDPVVQRATELEMGVLLPDHLKIIMNGPERSSHWAQRIYDHVRLRLGIRAHY